MVPFLHPYRYIDARLYPLSTRLLSRRETVTQDRLDQVTEGPSGYIVYIRKVVMPQRYMLREGMA